jgi:DNA-binding GntR family transcriptional regulator
MLRVRRPSYLTGFLNCGVDNLFKSGRKPLRETLPILKRIRLAIPKMKQIWRASAMSKQGRDQILERALLIEKEALEMIKKGHFTLDHCMSPE